MNKRTKTNVIIAIFTCLFFVGVFSYTIYQIIKQGEKLAESRQIISDHIAKEASYNKVATLLESTKADRSSLDTYFITEKETISFISSVEMAAQTLGVTMETTSLNVSPAVIKDEQMVEPSHLDFGLNFSGSETAVKKFVYLLENIPYQKSIPSLNLSNRAEGAWQGSATLHITITP